MNLPDSASTVLVADPGVADVQSTSPTSIFVTGMGAGRTNIVVRDAADTTVASYTVIVRNDTSGAQALLEDGLTIRQGGEVSVIRTVWPVTRRAPRVGPGGRPIAVRSRLLDRADRAA